MIADNHDGTMTCSLYWKFHFDDIVIQSSNTAFDRRAKGQVKASSSTKQIVHCGLQSA